MTDTSTESIAEQEAFAPPPAAGRRLPGADRARAFTEPPPPTPRPAGQLELPDVLADTPVAPAGGAVSWDRFTHEPAPPSADGVSVDGQVSTDALTDGGWVPPAPPEPPAEW